MAENLPKLCAVQWYWLRRVNSDTVSVMSKLSELDENSINVLCEAGFLRLASFGHYYVTSLGLSILDIHLKEFCRERHPIPKRPSAGAAFLDGEALYASQQRGVAQDHRARGCPCEC